MHDICDALFQLNNLHGHTKINEALLIFYPKNIHAYLVEWYCYPEGAELLAGDLRRRKTRASNSEVAKMSSFEAKKDFTAELKVLRNIFLKFLFRF